MKISTLARLALIGLVYVYASKLIDTFYHGLFRPVAFAGIIVGLNILAGIAQLAFFIVLYNYVIARSRKKWQIAAILAIIGSAVGLLPKFLALAVLLQHPSLFWFIQHGNQIGVFSPWLSAFLLMLFTTIFLTDFEIRCNIILKKAFTAGFTGWLVMFVSLSFVLTNYFHINQLVHVFDFTGYGLVIFVTTSTTTFICLIIFYYSFIKADLSNGTLTRVNK
jgi:hypothetical protein